MIWTVLTNGMPPEHDFPGASDADPHPRPAPGAGGHLEVQPK